jgi:hypothetical protein
MKFKKEPLFFQVLILYLHNKHCHHRVQGMAMKRQSEEPQTLLLPLLAHVWQTPIQ